MSKGPVTMGGMKSKPSASAKKIPASKAGPAKAKKA